MRRHRELDSWWRIPRERCILSDHPSKWFRQVNQPGLVWYFFTRTSISRLTEACIPNISNGESQTVDFLKIEDQKAGIKTLSLKATSSAGLPIYYFVREGPAEVDGNVLKFTKLPPCAKFPVKVTIVAWQHGLPGKVNTAEPVTREFFINKP